MLRGLFRTDRSISVSQHSTWIALVAAWVAGVIPAINLLRYRAETFVVSYDVELIYIPVGRAIAAGAVPYVEAADNKPPGWNAILALGGATDFYTVTILAVAIAQVLIVWWVFRATTPARVGAVAAVGTALLLAYTESLISTMF